MTKELDRKKHRNLRVLSVDALEEDARAFIEDACKLTDQGDLINVDAILQVSVSANYDLYNELKRRYPEMCEAMKTLMKDEMMEAQKKGEKKGEKKGVLETLFGLVKDGILSVSDAAKRANMNVAEFEKAYKMFLL